jgi:hypothetical protein
MCRKCTVGHVAGAIEELELGELVIYCFFSRITLIQLAHELMFKPGQTRCSNNSNLEEVRNSVVCHVDGGVGEGLDEVLLVPRQAAAQTKGARARPLVQPAQGVLERMAGLVTEEVHAGKTPLHLGPPLRLAIGEVPGRGKRVVRKGRGCA